MSSHTEVSSEVKCLEGKVVSHVEVVKSYDSMVSATVVHFTDGSSVSFSGHAFSDGSSCLNVDVNS